MDRGCIIEEATGVGAVLMQTAAFMSKKKTEQVSKTMYCYSKGTPRSCLGNKKV